jgi:hypothetical protein
MFVSQITITIILALKFSGEKALTKGEATEVLILVCVYVAAFAWSWGPLRWLVPFEIFPSRPGPLGRLSPWEPISSSLSS